MICGKIVGPQPQLGTLNRSYSSRQLPLRFDAFLKNFLSARLESEAESSQDSMKLSHSRQSAGN
jgi:hypothetical protein